MEKLALHRRHFPPQRRFQFPDLPFDAFDHQSPRIRWPKAKENHKENLLQTELPKSPLGAGARANTRKPTRLSFNLVKCATVQNAA
jgi:hypothetical protein